MERSFLILPGCDDRNRGDQALVWETVSLTKAAGYEGKYRMVAEKDGSAQTRMIGIENVPHILQHPSQKFKKVDNVKYTVGLKIKWGLASILELVTKEPLVHSGLRKMLKKLYSESVQDSLRRFEEAEVCFVKGGGFLHAYGGLTETYKIYYFLYHIRLAQSMGKPVYILPNSFGPFNSPFVKGMLQKTLSKCNVVMARESLSQAQLSRECKVDSYLFSDIAFHLDPDTSFDAKEELRKRGIPVGKKKCVAITARPYRFMGYDHPEERYQAYQKSLVLTVEWLSDHGFLPVFVEHVYDENSHENDMTCISDLIGALKKDCHFGVYANRNLTCAQMKKLYGAFDYIIGTRFHSIIFSLAQGVPAIAIAYGGNKGDGIMHDLGMKEFAVPIDSVTEKLLIDRFQTISGAYDQIKEHIREKLQGLAAEKDAIAQLLREE